MRILYLLFILIILSITKVNAQTKATIISPSSAVQGETLQVSINDQSVNFEDLYVGCLVTSVKLKQPGETDIVGSVTDCSGWPDDLTTSFTIPINASTGTWDFEILGCSPDIYVTNGFTIIQGNYTPTDISITSTTVNENETAPTFVGSLSTTDADAGDSHTYALVSGVGDTDNASFDIYAGYDLHAIEVFDYETKDTYYIRVETNDGNGGTYEEAFTININNINDAPSDISLTNQSIDENGSAPTLVGSLSTTDDDVSDSHTYTLASGTGDADNASFDIFAGYDLVATEAFDYETKNSYDIRIRTDDGNGGNYEESFTITINNINDIPEDISLTSQNISENKLAGTTIGSFSTSDQDAGNSHTYALVAGEGSDHNASFTISGSDLLSAESFNFENQGTYSIRVETDDGNGGLYSEPMTISISNVFEAPTDIGLSNTSIDENLQPGVGIGTLTTTDEDNGETYIYTLVAGTGDTDNLQFTISGDQLVSAADFDYETKDFRAIRVQTNDGNGGVFEKEFTITINNINEDPTSIELDNQTINENENAGTTVGIISSTDPDNGYIHTYSLVAGTGDTDNGLFAVSGNNLQTAASLNYETNSTCSIVLRADDGIGGSLAKQFTINVNDVNDAPNDIILDNTLVGENEAVGTLVGTFSTSDEDANDSHTYSFVTGTGDTDNASFTITNNQLITAEVFNHDTQNSYSIRIQTNDGNGGLFEKQFNINVSGSSALKFDGIDDYALIPEQNDDGFNISTQFTIEAWINPETLINPNYWTFIVSGISGGSLMFSEAGELVLQNSANEVFSPAGSIMANNWQHVAAVYQSDNLVVFYVNGLKVSESTIAISVVGTDNLNIGGDISYVEDRYFQGLIDEVRIWNTVRTQAQIESNMYTYLEGHETGLVAYYKFNEGSGQSITDHTNNAYNGTLGPNSSSGAEDPIWTVTNWPYTIAQPDLSLSDCNLSASTVIQGGSVNISYVVNNLTLKEAGEHVVKCYLSTDMAVTLGTETPLDTYTISSLAGNTSTEQITRQLTIPNDASLDEKYIIVVVDANEQITEDDETNNQTNLPITITEPNINYPDLSLSSVSLDVSTAIPGGKVQVNYIVDNSSTENAGAHVVNCYLSTDNAFHETIDTLLDSYNISALSANSSTALITRQITIPSDAIISEHQIFIVVDASKNVVESNENNNMASRTLNITEYTSHALSFDGTDDFVVIPEQSNDKFQIGQELTIETWIKPESLNQTGPDNYICILTTGAGCSFYTNTQGNLLYHYGDANLDYYVNHTPNPVLTNGKWQHVAMARDLDNNIKFFLDGNLISEIVPEAFPNLDYINFLIGGTEPGNRQFNGLIDEVRIWNTVRTVEEIAANLNNYLKGNEPGLVAYYQFNEGSGQTVYDRTTNGYHGTLGADALASSDDPSWTETSWPYYSELPDLIVVDEITTHTTLTLTPGAQTGANCRITNQGNGIASESTLKVYLSNNESFESGTDIELASKNVTTINANDTTNTIETTVTIPGETNPGDYYIIFVADADNVITESNESNNTAATFIKVEEASSTPLAPSDLSISTISSSELELSWTDNSDNEEGFEIVRSLTSDSGFEIIDSVASNISTYNDAGLNTNTQYWYAVRAYNVSGYSDDSNTATGTTDNTAPATPTDLLAQAGSKSRIDLSWTDNADNESGYKVYRSVTPGGTFSLIETLAADINQYSDEGLEAETTYYYKVCAYNNVEEACTEEVSETTLPDNTPGVNNAECCFGEDVPELSATGENLKWYSDSELTDQVGTGESFDTQQNQVGEHKYYVTQTVDNIESDAAIAILYIYKLPEVSAGENFEGCSSGTTLNANNPTGVGQWSIINGNGIIEDNLNPNTNFSSNETGTVVLRYTVTDEHQCVNYDEVTISLKVSPPEPDIHLKGGFIYICTNADMAGYQWYRDDIAITDATKQFYAADRSVTGTYSVEITNEQGCSNKAAFTNKTISLTLEETVHLYPIPFKNQLVLDINNEYLGEIKVLVSDFNGREIMLQTIQKSDFKLSHKLNTHKLNAGFYMVTFTFPNNARVHKRIIKN